MLSFNEPADEKKKKKKVLRKAYNEQSIAWICVYI